MIYVIYLRKLNVDNCAQCPGHFGVIYFYLHMICDILANFTVIVIVPTCPGRMFSYCVRARAYTHVLARVYSRRASTCTIYTCFTLPPTRVNPTGLQLSIFQNFGLL